MKAGEESAPGAARGWGVGVEEMGKRRSKGTEVRLRPVSKSGGLRSPDGLRLTVPGCRLKILLRG